MASPIATPKAEKSGGKQVRYWCYTYYVKQDPQTFAWNHPDLQIVDDVKYCVAQLEKCETTGRIHFQGYLELATKQRLSFVRDLPLPGAHWEPRGGTQAQAVAYCTKLETRVAEENGGSQYTFGTLSKGQGQRTDIEAAASDLVAGMPLREFAEKHAVPFVKYGRGFERLRTILSAPTVTSSNIVPKDGWQMDLYTALTGPPDNRTIHWVADPKGHSGKSTMLELLVRNHRAVSLTGRLADMAYAYNYEPIVCFDITRTGADYSDHLYSFAEMLKNGIISSPKYESVTKQFFDQRPHVVFFANTYPIPGKWTADRLKLYEVSQHDAFAAFTEAKAGAKRPRDGT